MNAAVSIDFETQARTTLEACILKMSETLNREFDPTDKQSMNLFRQFCAALRTHVQWVKNFFPGEKQAASKINAPQTQKTNDVPNAITPNGVSDAKTENAPKRESPIIKALIDETRRFGNLNPLAKKPIAKKRKRKGLRRKF